MSLKICGFFWYKICVFFAQKRLQTPKDPKNMWFFWHKICVFLAQRRLQTPKEPKNMWVFFVQNICFFGTKTPTNA